MFLNEQIINYLFDPYNKTGDQFEEKNTYFLARRIDIIIGTNHCQRIWCYFSLVSN